MQLREFIYLKKNKEILIATSNNGKIKEFENLLAEYKVVSLKDYDIEDAIANGEDPICGRYEDGYGSNYWLTLMYNKLVTVYNEE